MPSAAPSRQKIAQAKLLYDAGVAPISEILKLLDMSAGRFRRFREQNGWPLRAAVAARKPADAAQDAPPAHGSAAQGSAAHGPAAGGLAAPDLILRLEDAVEREFAHAEAALAKHAPKSVEVSARTLASLVRTLGELKRMRRETDDRDTRDANDTDADGLCDDAGDAPPRDLAELRAELARRLERLRGDGEAR